MNRAFTLCFLLLVACSAFYSYSERDESFENKLMAIAGGVRSSSKPATVRFTNLTSHDWDHVYIFGSYYPRSEIKLKLGNRWRPKGGVGFQQVQDGYVLVAFMKDGHVTYHSNLSPAHGDFSQFAKVKEDGYTPETATFELRKGKSGDTPWLFFYEPI